MGTWKHATKGCRWRFWRPHSRHERYASEVAEHICTDEGVWIARATPYGTSWLIDEDPVTLLEVLDHLPGAHYHWVIEQTMTGAVTCYRERWDLLEEPADACPYWLPDWVFEWALHTGLPEGHPGLVMPTGEVERPAAEGWVPEAPAPSQPPS